MPGRLCVGLCAFLLLLAGCSREHVRGVSLSLGKFERGL